MKQQYVNIGPKKVQIKRLCFILEVLQSLVVTCLVSPWFLALLCEPCGVNLLHFCFYRKWKNLTRGETQMMLRYLNTHLVWDGLDLEMAQVWFNFLFVLLLTINEGMTESTVCYEEACALGGALALCTVSDESSNNKQGANLYLI